MKPETLLEILHVAERLKNETRHSDTSSGRRESVAEHSWRLTLMAFLLKDEYPNLDMIKVMEMCLIHDLGEAFTGDIPVFEKTAADTKKEDEQLLKWLDTLPDNLQMEMKKLYEEMEERVSDEAKLYKALDGMEALIQHNEADIKTWQDNEYDLQLKYCWDRVEFSPYLKELRQLIQEDSLRKIEEKK